MKNMTNFLMNLDCDLWDLMGIEAGSDFMNADGSMNGKFDAYVKAVKNELEAFKISKVSKRTYLILEDRNYHTMNKALNILGLVA